MTLEEMQLERLNDTFDGASHVDLTLAGAQPHARPATPCLALTSRPVSTPDGSIYLRRIGTTNRWRFSQRTTYHWQTTTYEGRWIYDYDEVTLPDKFRLVHVLQLGYRMRSGGVHLQALRPVSRYEIWHPATPLPADDFQDTPDLRTTTSYASLLLWNPS